MSGTFDDVTAEQPTDTRLDNDAPWSAVKQRVTEKLAEAAGYSTRLRRSTSGTISTRGTQKLHREGSAIAFEHPTARGFRISEGSVTDGFNVHTSTGAERAVPQRAIVSTKRYVHSLDRCVTTAVARICAYSRDGAF